MIWNMGLYGRIMSYFGFVRVEIWELNHGPDGLGRTG